MRICLPAADLPEQPAYDWEDFTLAAIREACIPDYLLRGEPYLTLNAVVLTPQEHDCLVALTERFGAIFAKAATALARDTTMLERIGFPWVAAELLRYEPEPPVVLGRFDSVQDTSGHWWLLEYNADTPSGFREAAVADRLVHERIGHGLYRPNEGLVHRFASSVRGAASRCHSIGLVTNGGYTEDLAQIVFTASVLERELPDIELAVGDIDNVWLCRGGRTGRRGRLHLFDRPVDAVYRYYPFENMLGTQPFADLYEAVAAGRLRLLNGLRGLLAQNKGVLAWLWEHRADSCFSSAEQEAIPEHLPETHWITPESVEEDRRRAASLVVKQVFGREGEEVYFGDTMTEQDWRNCAAWGSFIAQRRVDVRPLAAAVHTSRGPAQMTGCPTVGSYCAAGRYAGYYTRLGAPITSASAKWVATWVEGGPT